jgi:hypothetical protein
MMAQMKNYNDCTLDQFKKVHCKISAAIPNKFVLAVYDEFEKSLQIAVKIKGHLIE